MAKMVKVKILNRFEDKENHTVYKRNDIVEMTEKRADELLKNTYLIEKVVEENQQEEKTIENTSKENTESTDSSNE